MIESKEEFNVLINNLKAKEKENKLGKSLQIKLRAFKEVEDLINKLTIPVVVQQSEPLICTFELGVENCGFKNKDVFTCKHLRKCDMCAN